MDTEPIQQLVCSFVLDGQGVGIYPIFTGLEMQLAPQSSHRAGDASTSTVLTGLCLAVHLGVLQHFYSESHSVAKCCTRISKMGVGKTSRIMQSNLPILVEKSPHSSMGEPNGIKSGVE